jgi:hypothetical protein
MQPYIDASPAGDKPPTNGCGWVNSVRFSVVGNAKIGVKPMTCEMAAALALWANHKLQPAARTAFGNSVERIHHMGTYNFRNIEGRQM